MRAAAIVEVEIAADRGAGLADAVVGLEVDLLVFDAAPQPFDKDIIPPSPFAVHADGDAVGGQHAGKGRAGELATLVRIEDLRRAVRGQRIFERGDAERGFHGDRHPPRQHAPRRPVEHGGEIDEALGHRDIGDVHRPDLIGPRDRQAFEKIREDLMPRLGLGGARAAVNRFDPHPPHQRFDMPVAQQTPLDSQHRAQHARPCEGELQVQFVEPPHDGKISR